MSRAPIYPPKQSIEDAVATLLEFNEEKQQELQKPLDDVIEELGEWQEDWSSSETRAYKNLIVWRVFSNHLPDFKQEPLKFLMGDLFAFGDIGDIDDWIKRRLRARAKEKELISNGGGQQ